MNARLLVLAVQVLRSHTFSQTVVGFVTVGGVMLVMTLLGYHIKWPLLPVIVAFYSTIGIGSDLQRVTFSRALLLGMFASFALAVLMLVLANEAVRLQKVGFFMLPVLQGVEIYAPLFLLLTLTVRWCARNEVHKAFVRGTARFDPEDAKRRRELIDKFKRYR